jgi:hypothetical protein
MHTYNNEQIILVPITDRKFSNNIWFCIIYYITLKIDDTETRISECCRNNQCKISRSFLKL